MAFWSPSSITDINEGSTANDGTGDSIRAAFLKVDENFSAVSSQLASVNQDFLNANISTQFNATSANIGNLILGNVNSSTSFYGNINVGGNIIPTGDGTYDLGSVDRPFRNLYYTTLVTGGVTQTSDAGLLSLHANILPGDVKDVGIFGNVSNSYTSNTYAFFGYQKQTNNFVYKITNTDAILGNSVVYDGLYGNIHVGSLFLSNSTPANSNVTGALIVTGGISSNNEIRARGNIYSGGYRVLNTADISTLGYSAFNGSDSIFFGNTVFATTTPSTTTTTGAIVVLGGMGVVGNISASGFRGNLYGNVLTANQPFITGLGTIGNLTVSGATTTSTLQATSIGTTGLTATTISTSALTGLSILNINSTLTVGTVNAATIGNTGTTITGGAGTLTSLSVVGNTAISPSNIAITFRDTTGTLTNSLLTAATTVNNFTQVALHNSNSGGSASSDFIAYADTGTNDGGYIDMGIASSGFNDVAYGVTKAGDGYIFVSAPQYANTTPTGGNLVLATADGTHNDIVFAAGGFFDGTEQGRFILNDGLSVTGNLIAQTGAIYQGEGAKTLINSSNATATLSSTINSGVTTITVNSTTGFLPHGALYVGSELMYYTNKTSTQFTSITRGTSGTTAASHTSGVTVYQPIAGLTNASTVLTGNDDSFVQVALKNHNSGASASTDMICYASNGDNDSGWIDMGITSETYNDATYGVTGPDDGYIFMSAPAGTTGAGSLFLSTSGNGVENDIVFSTDGFESGNERMRIVGQDRVGKPAGVEIYIPTTSTSTSTGALRVQGGAGIQGNLNVGGDFTLIGNISIGGTGSTTSTSTLVVENPITFLANGNPGNSQDIGIVGQYVNGGTKYTGFVRQATTGAFRLFDGLTTKPTTTVSWGGTVAGNVYVGSAIVANATVSSSTTTGALVVAGGVGIGGKAYVGGDITVTGSILPTANLTYNLGSASSWWSTFYGVSTQAKYADLAENYQGDAEYAPGTVLIFGGEQEVTTTTELGDERVAGAVSTNPAHLMNGGLTGTNVIALALRGRVPCRVIGPVTKGDSLVTSTIPGCAVSVGRDRTYNQAIFAKALETNLDAGEKTITVVIL